MPVLNILRYPDPRLYKKAVPVREVDAPVRSLVRDLAETMYAAPGMGLAATQVDVHQRVIVIDASETRDQLLVLINPEIIAQEGVQYCEEGCLSVPGVFEPVERAERVTVRALGTDGNAFTLEADKLLAVCIQHEIDHLEGKVFVDYLSRLKQKRIKARLQKQLRKSA
jgi:peptide deformylase